MLVKRHGAPCWRGIILGDSKLSAWCPLVAGWTGRGNSVTCANDGWNLWPSAQEELALTTTHVAVNYFNLTNQNLNQNTTTTHQNILPHLMHICWELLSTWPLFRQLLIYCLTHLKQLAQFLSPSRIRGHTAVWCSLEMLYTCDRMINVNCLFQKKILTSIQWDLSMFFMLGISRNNFYLAVPTIRVLSLVSVTLELNYATSSSIVS